MISAQCDRLRSIADDLVGMDYDTYAYEVRRAADTIWDLRCKLTGVVDQSDEIAQLNKSVLDLHKAYIDMVNSYEESEIVAMPEYNGDPFDNISDLRCECEERRHHFDAMLHELGIEVSHDV